MNMVERGVGKQAVLQYLDGEFRILTQGTYVVCAVSGARIPLEDLRYWNVDLQEAYATAEIANKRYADTRNR